jgi:hypothetical protein
MIFGGEEVVIFYHKISAHAAEKSLTILDSSLRPIGGSASFESQYTEEELFSLKAIPNEQTCFRLKFNETFDPKTGDLIGRYIAIPYGKFTSQFHTVAPIDTSLQKLAERFNENEYGEGGFPIAELSYDEAKVVTRIIELFLIKEEYSRVIRWNRLKPLFSNPLKTNLGPALVGIAKKITFRTTEGAYSIRVCREFYWNTIMSETQKAVFRQVHNMGDHEDPTQDTFPLITYRVSHSKKTITLGHSHKIDKRRSEFSTITIPYKPPSHHPLGERILPFVILKDIGAVVPNLSLRTSNHSKMLREFEMTDEDQILFDAASMSYKGRRTEVTVTTTKLSWDDYAFQKRNELTNEDDFRPLETLIAWTTEFFPTVHELPFSTWEEFLNVIESPLQLTLEQARAKHHHYYTYFLSIKKEAYGRKKNSGLTEDEAITELAEEAN